MLTFSTWSASVKVDDMDLPEYDVSYDEEKKTIECWIVSHPGRSFTVYVDQRETMRAAFDTAVALYLDDDEKPVTGCLLDPSRGTFKTMKGVRSSSNTRRAFVFSKRPKATEHDLNEGLIIVKFFRTAGTSSRDADADRSDDENREDLDDKLQRVRSSLGQEREVPRRTKVVNAHVVPDPYATFIFRYQTADVLHSSGLVRSPKMMPMSPRSAESVDLYGAGGEEEEEPRHHQRSSKQDRGPSKPDRAQLSTVRNQAHILSLEAQEAQLKAEHARVLAEQAANHAKQLELESQIAATKAKKASVELDTLQEEYSAPPPRRSSPSPPPIHPSRTQPSSNSYARRGTTKSSGRY